MLLVSDRKDHAIRGGAPTGYIRLGEPPRDLPPFEGIVCDVALDDLAMLEALRAVLAEHRPTAAMPLHVILRDDTIFARAIANALGATTVLEAADVTAGFFVGTPAPGPEVASRGADAPGLGEGTVTAVRPDFDAGPALDPTAAIGDLQRCFARMFEAAAARRALDETDLERSVDLLLRSVRRSEIGRWVEVVRQYDDATYQHCLLVAGLTAAFSMTLGLSPQTRRMLAQAALLHDIGKAKVPLAVLNKAGPLDQCETAAIRRHPTDGYYMLDRQPGLLPGVREVVRHHHEMLDGSGYPEGLRKSAIAEPVRIVTICDIGAALIERRPYRSPLSSRAAFAAMVSMGEKLDVDLLRSFEPVLAAATAEDVGRAA